MKYLYVLTSDDTDYYLEQALLSMTSLRLQMSNAHISLLTDTTTEAGLNGKRSEIRNICNELISVDVDERFNKTACSRWLKTSMRQHIKGDFLYIDCDTIIAGDLSFLDTIMNMDVGAVFDSHGKLSHKKRRKPFSVFRMQNLHLKLGFTSITNSDIYFNGGVIFCKDCAMGYKFFSEWHRLWLHCFEKGVATDQQSLNQANYNLGNIIIELDGEWNYQVMAHGSTRYLSTAKIIHYFRISNKKPYLFANQDIYKSIKVTGSVSQELKNMLAYSKSSFSPDTELRLLNEITFSFLIRAALYAVAKRIYNSKFGSAFESVCLFFLSRQK